MKAWKMVGSLLLLTVIICGCVVLGRSVEVSAKENSSLDQGGENQSTPPGTEEISPEGETSNGGSVSVEKLYSKGLYFRSNGDGTCALAGMGSCTSSCIIVPPESPAGDRVTAVLPFAFADSAVGAIELPATVTDLSAESCARCPRLAFVQLATGNTALLESDGVLYTADGSTLLYCPAARPKSELALHPSLKRIAAGAFAECTGVNQVSFQGSAAQWHAVIVGGENDPLYAASLRFLA